jgi:hypothetical protein
MADQALHHPPRRGPLTGRGRETSVAVGGSIAFHALVLGYMALRGLSGLDDPGGDVSDPFPFDDGFHVELVSAPPGERRHVGLSRIAPHDPRRMLSQAAERSREFHLPEPGRASAPAERAPDAAASAGSAAAAAPPAPSGALAGEAGRLAPFSGPARTSALACRSLAGTLTFQEQAVCDERFGRAARNARVIAGTDDPARDARFTAEGQAELDAYEALRAPLRPRTPCEGADMMGRCPFVITIPLFSRKF